MVDVSASATFRRWVRGLRDRVPVARINARLRDISLGNSGDAKALNGGLFKMRLHYAPGYRRYCLRDRHSVVVLCGGVKGSQRRDIRRANQLAKQWRQHDREIHQMGRCRTTRLP